MVIGGRWEEYLPMSLPKGTAKWYFYKISNRVIADFFIIRALTSSCLSPAHKGCKGKLISAPGNPGAQEEL